MADVTGTIGNEYVELNNAATEATLKQLLAAVQAQGGKGAAANTANLAAAAGIAPAATAANKGLQAVGAVAATGSTALGKLGQATGSAAAGLSKVADSITPFLDKLLAGTASVSDFTAPLSKLPGMFGVMGTLITKVMQYQEENVKTYREITSAGANFGGSLTTLRQAALDSYITLDQLSNLVRNNSDTFSRMGGTVNDGAKAFTAFTNHLISSDVGTQLMGLGLSTEQINTGMAQYIAATGGRTRQEMADRDGLTKSAKAYFEQLDALATITGQTREQQEAAMKEAAANQAWQAHLLTLDSASRDRANAAYNEAMARGGKGAAQALMSAAMGFPPMTKEAQQFTAITRNANSATMNLVKGITDSSKTVADIQRDGAAITSGLAEDGRNNQQLFKALVMQGGDNAQIAGQALGAANKASVQGIRTADDARAQLAQVQAEQLKRERESQARQMAEAEKAIKEMGQAFNANLAPAVSLVTTAMSHLVKGVNDGVQWFNSLSTEMKALGLAGAAVTAWLLKDLATKKASEAFDVVKQKLASPGSTPMNPMYVVVVNGPPGGGGPGIPEGPDKKPGGSQKPGGPQKPPGGGGTWDKVKKAGKGGLAGWLASMGLDYAADAFGRDTTAGSVAESGSSIAGWAGTGAMLGSVVPGIGTAAGAITGGTLAALYELYTKVLSKEKMANGGVVTQPTSILAGEAGSEAIVPLHHLESLNSELKRLNSQSAEILRYMKETADYTKQNVDATKSLGGDLFKF